MKPVDHVTPVVPGNWVRRPEDQRHQRENRKQPPVSKKVNKDQKQQPGQDPDGRTHIIDELA